MLSAATANSNIQCLCCRSTSVVVEPTLTSLFLSRAAWNGSPESTDLLYCVNCGFRTYTRDLSRTEAHKYYSHYRGKTYVVERSRDELFYSQAAYDRDEAWMKSPQRQEALFEVLTEQRSELHALNILDFGGGDGHLIAGLKCKRRAVFDFANVPSLSGIERIVDETDLRRTRWDVIVCAQTLEHISAPDVTLMQLRNLVADDGLIYIELPSQQWSTYACSGVVRNSLLSLARGSRIFHKLLDLYSTTFRVAFGILPPMGFVPMREHLNFFTVNAIVELGRRLSLEPKMSQVHPFCGIQVLFGRR